MSSTGHPSGVPTDPGAPGRRLLVAVAHPDDESFGCGSILALAAAAGWRATVCCATRGEAGEAALEPGQTLGAVRERELRAAAALLDVERVVVFDWHDSDIAGEPAGDTLVAAPLDTVADAIATVIDEVRPDVVVTLDGSDGHRDHLHVREATLAAVARAAWSVPRVYLSCLAQSLMHEWVACLQQRDPSSEYLELGRLGTPDHEITTVVDSSPHYELRWQVIRAHASQTSPFEVMPPELQRSFLATERLRRVHPAWEGGPIERVLFA